MSESFKPPLPVWIEPLIQEYGEENVRRKIEDLVRMVIRPEAIDEEVIRDVLGERDDSIVLVTGNIGDGFVFHGPFAEQEDVEAYAGQEAFDEWEIMTLHAPKWEQAPWEAERQREKDKVADELLAEDSQMICLHCNGQVFYSEVLAGWRHKWEPEHEHEVMVGRKLESFKGEDPEEWK